LTQNTDQYHLDSWRPFDAKHNTTQTGDGRLTPNTIPPRQVTAVWRQTQYHPDRWRPFDVKHWSIPPRQVTAVWRQTQYYPDRWRQFDAKNNTTQTGDGRLTPITIPPRQMTAVWRQKQYHPDRWRPFNAKQWSIPFREVGVTLWFI